MPVKFLIPLSFSRLGFLSLCFLCGGCQKEISCNRYGLTKQAKQITEYGTVIGHDSASVQLRDTLTVTQRFYNDRSLLAKMTEGTLSDKELVEIEIVYKEEDRVLKEIVYINADTIVVNYNYRDTLLASTFSLYEDSDFKFEVRQSYHYDPEQKLASITKSEIVTLIEETDTLKHFEEVNIYNPDQQLTETRKTDFSDAKNNQVSFYFYDETGKGKGAETYNYKDSLTEKSVYEYKDDAFGNWIEKKTLIDGRPKYLIIREIIYR